MARSLKKQILSFARKRKRLKNKKRLVTALAAVVVFCTTYALILPAITQVTEPICGYEVHIHDETCYAPPQRTCDCVRKPHVHEAACYGPDGDVLCPFEDFVLHVHDEGCYDEADELLCTLEQIEPHIHDESCYEVSEEETEEELPEEELPEEEPEEVHVEEPGFEEIVVEGTPVEQSPPEEEPIEDANAIEEGDTEELPEEEPVEEGYIEEDDDTEESPAEEETVEEERCLICGKDEWAVHIHDESCFEEDGTWICGLRELQEHIHTEECFTIEQGELICGIEEHTHDEILCYAAEAEQGETAAEWEQTLPASTGDPVEDLLAVAYSQLGYAESAEQVQTDSDGTIRGLTRYGTWYGDPYGPWDTSFLSFCIHYAGISEELVPRENNAYRLSMELAVRSLFVGCEVEYLPSPGDIVFFDRNGDGNADRAALAVYAENGWLTVIEGDTAAGLVEEQYYAFSDPQLVGYGKLTQVLGEGAPIMMAAAPKAAQTVLAQTTNYSRNIFTTDRCFVVYTVTDGRCYAMDGNGDAVEVYIDGENVLTDHDAPSMLLWTFSRTSGDTYHIQNVATGMYMHSFASNGGGVVTSGRYTSTLVQSGSGARVRSNSTDYSRLDTGTMRFERTQNQSLAAVFSFGMTNTYTVWLDGTNGGIMALNGAPDEKIMVPGGTFTLPETWEPSQKYDYVLQGWYDVTNHVYYAPGAEVEVTQNMVFYADWVASTYDIGEFNAQKANTVSTNDFITVRMFDYGPLFNVLSETVSVDVTASGHTETWSLLTSGNNPYNGEPTLGYIFRDWDRGNEDITYPRNHDDVNNPTNAGTVYTGLYNERLGELLFDPDNSFDPETGEGVIGKTYVGTGDHLFQLDEDPNSEHYGYYYYDSAHNAASYNQSESRFYVYEYLECTSDSANASEGKYSDFLPFNSPYANTNGGVVNTYSYAGDFGEYQGTEHYMYDAKYDSNGSATNHVATNYWFGMSAELSFYLPDTPGHQDADGNYGNQDVYGKDMHFKFTGDDDVWVFVDGRLVLDLGGIHGMESGDINFATGVVTVNGQQTGTLTGLTEGEHTLTMLYLERGASLSNCALYFNLAPRFSFSIEKEDVLTKEVLNGAEFSVFEDIECTIPATLWESKEAHDRDEPATNVFTVRNGVAHMWGMGAGNTYYIKETKPPDAAEYTYARGIICVSIDKKGTAAYNVILTEEVGPNGSTTEISGGFTVHGFRIDKEKQSAYIVATNAPQWVEEVTEVTAKKFWDDTLDHSAETIRVYLTVTDSDGTVRRLQEAVLSSENDWKHTWENLPKFAEDGVTEIQYAVEEAYVRGYYSKVEQVTEFTSNTTAWTRANTFENGKTYLLKTGSGYLATQNTNADTGYTWVSEDVAKHYSLALWRAQVSGNQVRLTNGANQTITFYYNGGSPTDFYASTGGESNQAKQYYRWAASGNGVRIYYDAPNNRDYYIASSMTNAKKFNYSTTARNGLVFELFTMTQTTTTEKAEGLAYQITNTPLEKETSLRVFKDWDMGELGVDELYEREQVTIKLLANGKDTGRTITLNLKNGWSDIFQGLPYIDENGDEIIYTVEEVWENVDFKPTYGEVIRLQGDPAVYEITVVNTYRWGHVQELPATGGLGTTPYTAAGLVLMLLAAGLLMYKKTRRKEEGFSPQSEQ